MGPWSTGFPPQYSSIPPRPPDIGNLERPAAADQPWFSNPYQYSVQYSSSPPPQQWSGPPTAMDSYPRRLSIDERRGVSVDPWQPPTWAAVRDGYLYQQQQPSPPPPSTLPVPQLHHHHHVHQGVWYSNPPGHYQPPPSQLCSHPPQQHNQSAMVVNGHLLTHFPCDSQIYSPNQLQANHNQVVPPPQATHVFSSPTSYSAQSSPPYLAHQYLPQSYPRQQLDWECGAPNQLSLVKEKYLCSVSDATNVSNQFNILNDKCGVVSSVIATEFGGIGTNLNDKKGESCDKMIEINSGDRREFNGLENICIKKDSQGLSLCVKGTEINAPHLFDKMSNSNGLCTASCGNRHSGRGIFKSKGSYKSSLHATRGLFRALILKKKVTLWNGRKFSKSKNAILGATTAVPSSGAVAHGSKGWINSVVTSTNDKDGRAEESNSGSFSSAESYGGLSLSYSVDSQKIDVHVLIDSDEKVITDEEWGEKELLNYATWASLVKAATGGASKDGNSLPNLPTLLYSSGFIDFGVSISRDKSKVVTAGYSCNLNTAWGKRVMVIVSNALATRLKHYTEGSKKIRHYALLLCFSGFDKKVRDRGSGHPLRVDGHFVLEKKFTGNMRLLWDIYTDAWIHVQSGLQIKVTTVMDKLNDIMDTLTLLLYFYKHNGNEGEHYGSWMVNYFVDQENEVLILYEYGTDLVNLLFLWTSFLPISTNSYSPSMISEVWVVASYVYQRRCKDGNLIHVEDSLNSNASFADLLECEYYKMQELSRPHFTIHIYYKGSSWDEPKGSLCIIHTSFEPQLFRIAFLTCRYENVISTSQSDIGKNDAAVGFLLLKWYVCLQWLSTIVLCFLARIWRNFQGYQIILGTAELKLCFFCVSTIQSRSTGGSVFIIATLLSRMPLIKHQLEWLHMWLDGLITLYLKFAIDNSNLWKFVVATLPVNKVEKEEDFMAVCASSLEKDCCGYMRNAEVKDSCKEFGQSNDQFTAFISSSLDKFNGIGWSTTSLQRVKMVWTMILKAFGPHQYNDDYVLGKASLLNHPTSYIIGDINFGSKDDAWLGNLNKTKTAKLFHCKKQEKSCMLAASDEYRFVVMDQLVVRSVHTLRFSYEDKLACVLV